MQLYISAHSRLHEVTSPPSPICNFFIYFILHLQGCCHKFQFHIPTPNFVRCCVSLGGEISAKLYPSKQITDGKALTSLNFNEIWLSTEIITLLGVQQDSQYYYNTSKEKDRFSKCNLLT